MKTKFIAFAFMVMFAGGMVMAQDDKFGSDPKLCQRSYTLYKEFHRQKNYKDALPYWNVTIAVCPKFSSGIWSDGEKMFKARIKASKDLVEREVLIDSLLWIYDKRIEYFGNNPRYPEGYILGNKGVAMLNYRKDDVMAGYKTLRKSIELRGKASKPPVVLTYMQASRQLFVDGLIDPANVLEDYELVMNVIDANLKDNPNDVRYNTAKNGIETHFTKSGAADCDALEDLYKPLFEDNKADAEWLNKISKQLRRAGCTDSELFSATAEALYAVNPDANAGHNLAVMFMRQEEFEKAADYLKKAIEIGQDSDELGDMYYELAHITFSHYKKNQAARKLALQAIAARPNWGDPYILIGQIYVQAREDIYTDSFDRSTVFWAAIDKFAKAKRVDPEVADKVNDLIRQYSKFFPNNEAVFFHALKDGDSYKIGGWINETTTVRSRKQ